MNTTEQTTRSKFPLSERKIIKKTLSAGIVWFILLIFVIGFCIVSLNTSELLPREIVANVMIGSIVVFGLIVLITYLYQLWYFKVYSYNLSENFIMIKKGPITPHEITIPYERVQDVYVDQDLLDRIFKIYDVHLSSATASSGMQAHIDGVERASADGLREILLNTVHQKLNKNKIQPLA